MMRAPMETNVLNVVKSYVIKAAFSILANGIAFETDPKGRPERPPRHFYWMNFHAVYLITKRRLDHPEVA